MSIEHDFLKAILGEDGANALARATKRVPTLTTALVPRAVMSWIETVGDQYEGTIPGVADSYLSLKKSEAGYTGEITIDDAVYSFEAESAMHVASATAVAIGVDHFSIHPKLRKTDLSGLGKSIDLLAKARAETSRLAKGDVPSNEDEEQEEPYRGSNKDLMGPRFDKARRVARSMYAEAKLKAGKPLFAAGDRVVPKDVEAYKRATNADLTGHVGTIRSLQDAGGAHQYVVDWEGPPGQTTSQLGYTIYRGKHTSQVNQGHLASYVTQKAEPPGKAAAPRKQLEPIQAEPPIKAPRQKRMPTLKLNKSEITDAICPTCGDAEFLDGAFIGCLCFKDLVKAGDWDLVSSADGYVFKFGSSWDAEDISALMDVIKR